MHAEREAVQDREFRRAEGQKLQQQRRRALKQKKLLLIREQEAEAAAIADKKLAQEDLVSLSKEVTTNQRIDRERALKERRKHDEAIRYISALRKRLQTKIAHSNYELPPLCSCDHRLSSLEPVWEQCANNCVFYRNPLEYGRALSNLFHSLDL